MDLSKRFLRVIDWFRAGEAGAQGQGRQESGTLVFATVGRAQYAFDVFAVSLPADFLRDGHNVGKMKEECLTDGKSVNFNGYLVDDGKTKEEVLQWIKKRGGPSADNCEQLNAAASEEGVDLLIYVTEREGCLRIFYSLSYNQVKHGSTLEALLEKWEGISSGSKHKSTHNVMLPRSLLGDKPGPELQDRPQIGGGKIVFVSTEQDPGSLRQSWSAVYSIAFGDASSQVICLTPKGVSDFSPSLSLSGKWVVAASLQGKGWQGEVHMLDTDLYVFDASDGSQRRLVMKNAGWPSWADECTIYFHRVAEDGWWSVFRLSLSERFLTSGEVEIVEECRVTPPGVHAFTPSASRTGDWIAVATRRPGSNYRHVEMFDLQSRTFTKVTENISPNANHYNPFISPSSGKIVYHHCRGEGKIVPLFEPLVSPVSGLALLRLNGTFPSVSHDGSLLAYVPGTFDQVIVTRWNGEGKRTIFSGPAFGTAWDWKRKGVVYIASGKTFSPELATVHIIAIFDAHAEPSTSNEENKYQILTKDGTGNNAFPSPSPDGKELVFRSGRNGHKNLYIMDAMNGEEGGIRQLTDGPWTDTMANWSPTGEWIAFSSNRDDPNREHFTGYLIHPDGSGLRKILDDNGRVNHLSFSPDGQSLVFTSDFAAVSGEPIACPNQFQPYGEIYIAKVDGSAPQRLTHNQYEDGTPCWGPKFIASDDLSSERGDPVTCGFSDSNFLAQPGVPVQEGTGQRNVWCRVPNR
ncbi:unnamed protein product [Calypogeia fissa]